MVSIVIPVYNGAQFLEETLESCVNQTFPDIEIIVVDDCSSDSSVELVSNFDTNGRKLRLVRNESNSGFCKSANNGIVYAKGEFLLVLGQDDVLPDNHIEAMLPSFTSDVGAVYCDYYLIDENGEKYQYNRNEPCREVYLKDFRYNCPLHSCGLMVRTNLVKELGGYPVFKRTPQYGEWYLWIGVIKKSRIVFTDKTVALYRRHKNNVTNNFAKNSSNLNWYWNQCRLLAMKSKETDFLGKISILLYIIFSDTKEIVKTVLRHTIYKNK